MLVGRCLANGGIMEYSEILALCLLRISDPTKSDVLMQFVQEAEELITNYINQQSVPDKCKMVWVAIACDIYKYNLLDFTPTSDVDSEVSLPNISTIKIDDAEVSDNVTPALIAARAVRATREIDFLKDYHHRLHPFRKLRWTM